MDKLYDNYELLKADSDYKHATFKIDQKEAFKNLKESIVKE